MMFGLELLIIVAVVSFGLGLLIYHIFINKPIKKRYPTLPTQEEIEASLERLGKGLKPIRLPRKRPEDYPVTTNRKVGD